MRIYIDTLIFGRQVFGGISNVWYEYLSRMIKDKSVELSLIDLEDKQFINKKFIDLDKDNVEHIKEKGRNINFLRLSNPIIKTNDKCIFQSTDLRICKNKNVKNIVIIHDNTHQLFFKGIKKIINTYQKRKAIKYADGIIYISENTKKDTNRFFKKSNNKLNKVIYIAASNDFKKTHNLHLPERYKDLVDKKFILYVGDRTDYKNVSFLYQIIRKKENIDLVIVGGKEFEPKEIEQIEDIKQRIFHYRKVPNEELNVLYNLAYCSIYPSLYEGFGIPVLEAMKSGCPVIAFNNSSIPEVLRGSGILLNNNDVDACLEELNKLEDDNYRQEIIEKQIEKSKFFDWDKSYKELIEFYKKVINK